MEIADLYQVYVSATSVVTDTRKIQGGEMFFALKGDNFNGNTFAQQALGAGAIAVVIDQKDCYIDERTILVDDVLDTLQELANYHRNYLALPIIALTGSNGKTTTKELFKAVLSQKYEVKATVGNLNNHIGVPLTLLSFDEDTQIGIVEMGANHQTEIAFLCEIAEPNFVYITNFGKAHLEGFGGVEGVIKGKSEIYDYISETDQVMNAVFVNGDDPIQVEKTIELNHFSFSMKGAKANVQISQVQADPFVSLMVDGCKIQSQLIGIYNATNIAAAVTVGEYFKVPVSDIKAAIEGYVPSNNRSQIIEKKSNRIILDAYNANPSSMLAALENFFQLENPNKVLFLGDMFELGKTSQAEHQLIVDYLTQQTGFKAYLVGEHYNAAQVKSEAIKTYPNFESLAAAGAVFDIQDGLILIKGSRGMALERVLEML